MTTTPQVSSPDGFRRRYGYEPVLIVVGLVLAGGVYLAYLVRFRRRVLTHEPGE